MKETLLRRKTEEDEISRIKDKIITHNRRKQPSLDSKYFGQGQGQGQVQKVLTMETRKRWPNLNSK